MAERSGAVHFLILGLSRTPVGGYKVVYEYANALVSLGVPVTIWHSRAFFGQTRRFRTPALLRSLAHRLLAVMRREGSKVPWFELDQRVSSQTTVGLPRPELRPGDIVVGTAVETLTHAAALAKRADVTSAALIQHYEDWAASPAYIDTAWRSVDRRVVIAPWLTQKCTELGLDSYLLPNAIHAERFPAGPPLVDRPARVLSLLAPHSYKRPDVVIAALRRVGELLPGVQLTAFGQSKPPDVLPAEIRYLQDPSPQDLVDLYQSTQVYLCGSDAEGWHLPPAEATLCGAAVVSTDIGGVRASMEDDALYSPPGDPFALADIAIRTLNDLDASQKRVDRCRARLVARTYEANARELLAALLPG